MSRKVWFEFVNATTRGCFAGLRPTSVVNDGVNDIDELRTEIHAVYDHMQPSDTNILAHAAPSQLKVP
ncbi:TPA: hypothetical protein N0F65_012667 [Lagenidium giganteum]|uniref:Uncharacterized protein n=1 Tax=Lagenidium giganteum TaxID=4803 RepID=A0AAV2YNP2_9STRA|nr:TPA: hypothetical protein N0F65_012667 [Lagenidium giganteum]